MKTYIARASLVLSMCLAAWSWRYQVHPGDMAAGLTGGALALAYLCLAMGGVK